MRASLLIILWISLLSTPLLQAQKTTFRASYFHVVETLPGKAKNSEKDTLFKVASGIFEYDGNNITIHNFQGPSQQQILKPIGELTYLLKHDKLKLLVKPMAGDSVIHEIYNQPENYLVLKPFSLKNSFTLDKKQLENTSWQSSLQESGLWKIFLQLKDSSKVNYTVQQNQQFIHYSGNWKLLKSGPYHLIYLIDNNTLNEFIFYIKSFEHGEMEIEFDIQDLFEFPSTLSLTLNQKPLFKQEDLKKIEDRLIGTWKIDRIEGDLAGHAIDTLQDIIYALRFYKHHVFQNYNQTSIMQNQELKNFESKKLGNWKISPDGRSIIIEEENGRQEIILFEFENEQLLLNLNFQMLEDLYIHQCRIWMKKAE